MSWRQKAVKRNVPKVDLQSYNVLVAGSFKSGKTRLWKEVMELHYPDNPDAGLLLAFEDGYTTWELDSYIDMHNKDWDYFKKEVVKNLVEEAKTGSITKVIGIDTVDRLIDMCSEWFIKEWNKKYAKNFTSIQEFNENIKDENVYTELKKEIWRQIDILKRAGYGFFWLAWTKEKETTTIDGLKFQSIELMMSKTGKDIFESQAHLVTCLFNEAIVTDKDGNELEENAKTKKNKEIASKFHKTETYMYFRPSSYISIAGGRFTDLPERVEYSAENFMKVFEDAVEGQLKKTKKSIEELRDEETKEREQRAKETAEQIEEEQSDSETAEELRASVAEEAKRFTDQQIRQLVIPEFRKIFGQPDYRKVNDVTQLTAAVEFIKNLAV
ncbi:AAA family ATPase [Paenibacillus medicaginis]|uniref:AAA family ATPase n=1 Tax=Paenibacillus medicaginis TaxID=1470560 RepID=A0ABV5BUN4_9BACL